MTGRDSSRHAEAAALGALLLGGDIDQARRLMPPPGDPYGWLVEGHAVLWSAVCEVASDGDQPDMPSVTQRLMDTGRLDVVGGAAALSDLVAAAPAPSTLPQWAATVADRAHRRRMHAAALKVIEACADFDVDPAAAIVELDAILDDAPTQGGLQLVTGDRLHALPDPEWLVEDRVTRGLTVVWGAPKSGKSWLTVDLTVARAVSGRWHGMTVRPGRTLYCAAEGLHDVKARMQAAFDMRAATPQQRANVAVSGEPIDLGSSRDLARLDQAIDQHDADLLILDTWARVSGLTDENDAAEANRTIHALDRLRHRHSCDVIAVHHSRKDGMKMRGTTALLAALDTAVKVWRDRDRISADASDIRGGPEWPRPVEWRLRKTAGSAVLELPSDRLADDDIDQAVRHVVAALSSGTVLEASVVREHSRSVLARVKQHPDVDIGTDERGRPVLARRQRSPL